MSLPDIKLTSKVLLLTLIISFSIHPTTKAQTVGDSVRYVESVWNMHKKGLVLKFMSLTEAEKSAFWPIYDSYSNAIQYLEMEYIQILSDYAKDFKGLEAHDIERQSATLLKNEFEMARVRKQYYRKFSRALSPLKATEFMQLDNTLRTMLRLEVQKNPDPVIASHLASTSKAL